MSTPLPDRTRVVIVGGGVIGTSIAYHLAELGWSDVVVLERDRLTSGTTWHAAGLMTCFGSLSETSTRMRLYSRDLYARLEGLTGQSTGFRPVGLIEAAADHDRLEEYRRVAAFQRRLGLEIHEIGPDEMADLFPLARTDDLVAGFYVPGDGRVNPVDLTMSLAKGARAKGVRIIEGVSASRVLTRVRGHAQEVTGVVVTSTGSADPGAHAEERTIACDVVVNAAGMWARELAARNGVLVPNQAAEHYYLITEPIAGMSPDAPVFEDPAAYGYYREEGGGMMVGLFEPVAAPWAVDGVPQDFSFGQLKPDWERMGPFVERAMARVPVTETVGIRTFFCGPESFTPDLAPAVGEVSSLRGYFVCAGMNSVGVLSSGGMGRIVAQWIVAGTPDVDVTGFHVDRFQEWQLDPRFRADRIAEILGTVYAAHTPGRQLASGRGVLRSPVHKSMVAAGGFMRDVSGYEGADWYAGSGAIATADPTWGRAAWFEQWRAEHEAVRTAVGLTDMSFMAKLRVRGRDAGLLLDTVSAAAVDGPEHTITYTQWLSESGGIEADLTVTKLAADDFLVVASDTARGHVWHWLHRAAGDLDVSIVDETESWVQLNLQGPRSREVLQSLCPTADLSTEAFPFRAARALDFQGHRVLATRITYVGELGYELYTDAAAGPDLWDALMEHGAAHGIRPAGLKSLASLRLEKGYRDYGHDIDNTDTVWSAGLGFAVALDKEREFIGRAATLAAKERGTPHARLVQILLSDPEPLLYHGEVVYRDGVAVGDVRAGSYGWTLGAAVGLAFVEHEGPVTGEWLADGTWEVDIAGRRWPATVSLRPFYDPRSERVRA